MANDLPGNILVDLRASANQSLQRFARNRRAVAMSSLTVGLWQDKPKLLLGTPAPSPSAANDEGHASNHFGPAAGGARIDDERQVRAMAKELKRLIAEDRRRGLGIGG